MAKGESEYLTSHFLNKNGKSTFYVCMRSMCGVHECIYVCVCMSMYVFVLMCEFVYMYVVVNVCYYVSECI